MVAFPKMQRGDALKSGGHRANTPNESLAASRFDKTNDCGGSCSSEAERAI
jgi:hypothetical protein